MTWAGLVGMVIGIIIYASLQWAHRRGVMLRLKPWMLAVTCFALVLLIAII